MTADVDRAHRWFSELLSSMPGVVWEAWGQPDAARQRINFVSSYVEPMLGYSVQEWLATSNFWLSIVHPDDREAAAATAREAFAAGRPHTNQFRWITRDGRVLWVEAHSIVIFDEAGTPVGMRGVTLDITQRKTLEERLRESEARKTAMFATALDCIISMDDRGAIVDFNAAAERTFGYRREDVIGREMAELIIPTALRERHRQGLARYLETGEGPVLNRRVELTALRADGAEFPVELSVTQVPLSGPALFTGYLRDITDRKQAEAALRKAIQAREDFVSTAAHELHNPLNALQLQLVGLHRAAQERDDPLAKEWVCQRVGQATETVARLVSLVHRLLDMSRISTGRLDLEPETVELSARIRVVVERHRQQLGDRRLTLDLEQVGGRWDRLRLDQVLTNLLSNAIKYGEDKPIEISLKGDPRAAYFSVTDHGIGIAADHQPRLFEQFERAVSRRQYGGFGLGLWITRRIVEAMGGTVSVVSRPGGGSTFSVMLPREPVTKKLEESE